MTRSEPKTSPRRSQAQRREQTIAKLVQATIDCLVDLGYSGTTTAAIAQQAGLSQGAIFRHFDSRQALLIQSMEDVADRFIQSYREQAMLLRQQHKEDLMVALHALRNVVSSREQIAWFEVQQAARTDQALCQAFRPVFLRNQEENVALGKALFPDTLAKLPMNEQLIQLLILMFHGQTLDAHIEQNPDKEQEMLALATTLGQLGISFVLQDQTD